MERDLIVDGRWLLQVLYRRSLRLVLRPTNIHFDETRATILMDMKEFNGIKVGEIVNIKSLKYYNLKSENKDVSSIWLDIPYTVMAFVRVEGRFCHDHPLLSNEKSFMMPNPITDIFCILMEDTGNSIVTESPANGAPDEVLLFWAGGLKLAEKAKND